MSAAVHPALMEWDARRRRAFRRMLAVSAAGHALVVVVLLFGPRLDSRPLIASNVVTVDLVASPPAPTPAPRRATPPAPTPAQPVPVRPSRILLPERPERVVLPEALPTPATRPRPEPVEESYEDLLERLRQSAGEERPEPVEVARREPPPPTPAPSQPVPAARPAPAAASAPAGARGVRASPEVVGWVRDARIHVRRQWVLSAGFRTQALETHVEVELDAQGNVLGEPEITKRSGNPWYDESVVRAIQKADPLPAPPEAGKWPFVFRPEDY